MTETKETVKKVKVIATKDNSSLVEYMDEFGMLQRVTILTKNIDEGEIVKLSKLTHGLPYGIDWEEMKLPIVTSKDLSRELRNRGIWTADDARRRSQDVRGAVLKLHGPLLRLINEFIIGK